ncbi:MAG: hypothetical protein LBI92_03695 [Azoarcus sp.]|jgi:hypothetical protein|nr:hypothetical protein [Azoarcus sp.]
MTDGPHLLTIRLRSSPVLQASILAAHFAAGLTLFCMALPTVATLTLTMLVVASTVWAWRAETAKRGMSLVLAADGAVVQMFGKGGDAWARVLPGAVVFPTAVWFALGWTDADGRAHGRRFMLTAAGVEEPAQAPDQWRRLRVWLRHRALQRARLDTTDAV